VPAAGGTPIGKAAIIALHNTPTIILACIVVLLCIYMFHEGNVQYYDTPPVRNRFSDVSSASERYRPGAGGNTVDDIRNLRR